MGAQVLPSVCMCGTVSKHNIIWKTEGNSAPSTVMCTARNKYQKSFTNSLTHS